MLQCESSWLVWQNKNENLWLLHKYPHLQHFKLTQSWNLDIGDVGTLFRKNPNIRTFSTNLRCLLECKRDFIKFMPDLDELRGRAYNERYEITLESVMDLLTDFYEPVKKYKQLHLSINSFTQQISDRLTLLQALESLNIRALNLINSLPELIQLKKLSLLNIANETDSETLEISLINLEQLSIYNATIEDIVPVVRQSVKLTQIKIAFKDELRVNPGDFKVRMFYRERGRLLEAQKLTIYVPNNIIFWP